MVTLEKSQRLKDSVLWELQNLAYAQFGPDAWAKKGVPFYLTSNPLIAKQFAQVILAYLRDCSRKNAATPMDFSEPLFIFDLGAGSGRLGYLVLKSLLPMLNEVFSGQIKLCYVMTDIVKSNIEFWQRHPLLKESIDAGILDFAYYRHTDKTPIQLIRSGKILTRETIINPIVLLCTYFFDTLPQDFFRARGGRLEEGRITLTVPGDEEPGVGEKLDPSQIMNLEAGYDYTPIEVLESYYPDRPDLNTLLVEYAQLFDDTPFLFPIGSFESIQYFQNLSQGRMLLLAGDQGVCTEQQIRGWGEPKIFRHASFSMAVSYHCIAHYFRNAGGVGLLTTFPNPKFAVISAILGGEAERYFETALAFRDHVDFFEPVEYWELTNIEPEHLKAMPLENLLLLIKLGNWDPINLFLFYEAIRQKISMASEDLKEQLCQAIFNVWENCYPVNPEEGHFVMNLGVLLFELGKYKEALLFFQRGQNLAGENKNILMNIAKCYRALGDSAAALQFMQRAISL